MKHKFKKATHVLTVSFDKQEDSFKIPIDVKFGSMRVELRKIDERESIPKFKRGGCMNRKGEAATIVFLIVVGFVVAAMVQGRLTGKYVEKHKAVETVAVTQ